MNKPLLILDLDETLIYGTPSNEYQGQAYDFNIGQSYYIKKRPNVDKFLQEVSIHFDLAVWTAASKVYGEAIVEELFRKNDLEIAFFKSRSDCVCKEYVRVSDDYYPQEHFIKDLKKIKKNYDLDKVLIVDDMKLGLVRNYGNLVHIPPFKGNIEDNYLLLLKDYLFSIKEHDNLRSIEKRNWINNLEVTLGKKKLKI